MPKTIHSGERKIVHNVMKYLSVRKAKGLATISLDNITDLVVNMSVITSTSCHPQLVDYYHDLHLPHEPPLYPVHHQAPATDFTCVTRGRGYYADVGSGCQAYHFCWHQRLVSTDLCANGTLFNEQFQVCDHFYNVRCGSPYEDL